MPINPDYTYGNKSQELEPYMLYGDRSAAGRSLERRDSIVQDLEYLQGMYPGHMKQLQEYVVSACDHLDYKNSPMYDEYPDRMMINQICDSICDQIRKDGILMDEVAEEPDYAETTAAEQELAEQMEWGAEEMDEADLLSQDRGSTWDPWGPKGPRGREGREGQEDQGDPKGRGDLAVHGGLVGREAIAGQEAVAVHGDHGGHGDREGRGARGPTVCWMAS